MNRLTICLTVLMAMVFLTQVDESEAGWTPTLGFSVALDVQYSTLKKF